jgi:hypothetical protein
MLSSVSYIDRQGHLVNEEAAVYALFILALAARFFERITNGRRNEGSGAPVPLVFPLAQGVQTGLPQDNT